MSKKVAGARKAQGDDLSMGDAVQGVKNRGRSPGSGRKEEDTG